MTREILILFSSKLVKSLADKTASKVTYTVWDGALLNSALAGSVTITAGKL